MHPTNRILASIPAKLLGSTGKCYQFKELLQNRALPGCVWTATCGQKKFVLKDVPIDILANFNERIWPRLRERPSPLLRLPVDKIPKRDTLVYNFLTDDFLQLVTGKISINDRRRILKASIEAIAELHSKDVIHLDIKPDNIMVNCIHEGRTTTVLDVQLTDLENAAYLPERRCIKGMLAGNDNSRSPEAHFKGELTKPSDVFSFGLVCLYAVTGKVTCGPDEDFHTHESQGALPAMIRLQRQVSYFGDLESLRGLTKHVGDEDVNQEVLSMLWEDRNEDYIPYRPFSTWPEAEDYAFRDVINGTMNLDPSKRLTAAQILRLPWFSTLGDESQ